MSRIVNDVSYLFVDGIGWNIGESYNNVKCQENDQVNIMM